MIEGSGGGHIKSTAWRGLLRACLLAVALGGNIAAVMAAEPDLVRARELLRAGKAAEAYALLEPFEVQKAGDLVFDYLLATAALQSGKPSKATFIYERILSVAPDYAGVRADMARAYYELGDYARAKLEFELVLTLRNLPPDLRSAVEQYVVTIEGLRQPARTVLRGYAQAGYGRDSNINSAGAGGIITGANGEVILLGAAGAAQPENYWSLGIGGEINHQAAEKLSVFAAADYQGRFYSDHGEVDYGTLDGRIGASHAGGRYQVTGAFYLGRYWLDDRSTRDNHGVNLDWRYALDAGNQVSASLFLMRYRYSDELAANHMDYAAITLGWNRALGPSTALGVFLGLGEEQARNGRPDGDKEFMSMRITLQSAVARNLGAFANAGVQWGDFQVVNPAFNGKRDDVLYDATLGLSWIFADRWSLQPQVVWIRNDSNIPSSDFDRTDYLLLLRRDFY